jgi:hypothetical protein
LEVAEARYQTPASEYVAYRWRTAPDAHGAVAIGIGWRRWRDVERVAADEEQP